MKITIAGKDHAAHRPDDLNERMIATSGVSLAEAVQMARDTPTPANMARAIAPFIELDHVSLGMAIAQGGTAEALKALDILYADPPEPVPTDRPVELPPTVAASTTSTKTAEPKS